MKGGSTLELLIALAILSLTLTAVVSVVFGNQSITIDTEINSAALQKTSELLRNEQVRSKGDYLSSTTTGQEWSFGSHVIRSLTEVTDLTPCKKRVTGIALWNEQTLRPQNIQLSTLLVDVIGVLKVGGDCFTRSPRTAWQTAIRFASDTITNGKPKTLDVLNGILYMGIDKSPYFLISDTRNATPNQASGLWTFSAPLTSLSAAINSLDVVRLADQKTGERYSYVYAAMHSTTSQLVAINVSNPKSPSVTANVSLSPCVTGSYPQGWFVYVYDEYVYLVTRETAGPEFHIFDISRQRSVPVEIPIGRAVCKGYELTDTVEQMIVRDQISNGVTKRYAYLVTNESDREIRVLDVTNPFSIFEATHIDLPGSQDAMSLSLVGERLYVGRQSTLRGPELYVYNTHTPYDGLQILGTKEVGSSVVGIRIAGPLAFIATTKVGQELQFFDVTDTANIVKVTTYAFLSIAGNAMDYENDFLYVSGQSTPQFQILHSP